MEKIEIRRLDEELLFGVAELETLCFSSPWSKKSLELLCKDGAVGFAAVDICTKKVYAYGGMLVVPDEGQITNIATHPDVRRRGLGREIVGALVKYARENNIFEISLEVRESNIAAISLYKNFGFKDVGLRKNFYSAPIENAIVMVKNIGGLQ